MDEMTLDRLDGHIILCGWNETGRKLVADLLATRKDYYIVVISAEPKAPLLLERHVFYVERDPSTPEALRLARAERCKVAVILPKTHERRSAQDVDARSILTILAIERVNPAIHTIVELLSDENIPHARNAGCDEIIVSGAYTGTMLSQVVQYPGISSVFGSLFRPGEGTQVDELALPSTLEGSSFSQVCVESFKRGLGIVVGFRRDDALTISPRQDPTLERGDRLVLIRQMSPPG